MAGTEADPEVGNSLFLSDIPLQTTIHNIESFPGSGGKFIRAGGGAAVISKKFLFKHRV